MEYEGRICRAPKERASFMLPVAVGCAYNRCRFCGLFKDLTYRELPLEQIEDELKRVAGLGGDPKVVYLGDGNAFHLETDRLVSVLEMVHRYFPGVREIRMDSTIPDILSKTDEELNRMSSLKVKRLYIGIETALPDVLKFMNKCHTMPMAYEAVKRIKNAGIDFAAHVMSGVAGKGRGLENAEALAAFVNDTKPLLVVNFDFFTDLMGEEIASGRFVPADLDESLSECRRFLELVDADGMEYDASFGFPPDRIWGTLPKDRGKMIAAIDGKVDRIIDRKTAAF